MSKLIVHGRATSSNVQTVMWTAAELGLEFDRLDVGGMYGGNDTPEYLAMNPTGLVPTLQDGDVTLFESCAILRYLAAKYGDEAFWPSDPTDRAVLDQWAEWGKGTLVRTVIYDIFWILVRTPKAQRNMDALAAGIAKAADLMKMLDKRLGEAAYLNGDKLSFADIVVGHVLYRYFTLDFDRPRVPHVEAYYQRLTERQAYADNVMIDYSSLRVE